MRVLLLFVMVAACGQGIGPDGIRSGSRLRATFLEDADGVRSFSGFHDTVLDVDCSFWADENAGIARCIPSTLTQTQEFSDPGCTKPVVEEPAAAPACGPLPTYLGVPITMQCQQGLSVWKLGPQIHPGLVYSGTPGDCTGAPPSVDSAYYAAGEPVSLDTFVAGRLEIVGDHRLQDRVIVGDDGARVPYSSFDRDLGTDCYPQEGQCVPPSSSLLYTDSGCSDVISSSTTECAPYQAPYVTELHFQGCTIGYEVHDRGDPITPTALYSGAPDSCQQIDVPTDSTFWSIGAAIPNDSLLSVATTISTESPGRLQYEEYTTADGYRRATGLLHDTQLDTDCFAAGLSDGHTRCVPTGLGYVQTAFSDAQCQVQVTVISAFVGCGTPPPPAGYLWVPDTACSGHIELHALGAEVASGVLYTNNGSCAPFTWDTTQTRYYQLGARIPDATYVELDPVTE